MFILNVEYTEANNKILTIIDTNKPVHYLKAINHTDAKLNSASNPTCLFNERALKLRGI